MTQQSVFTGQFEQPAQPAQNEQNPKQVARGNLLASARRLIKNSRKILRATDAFLASEKRQSISEAEMAALRESLRILNSNVNKLINLEAHLSGGTPEERARLQMARDNIAQEYRKIRNMIEEEAVRKIVPLKTEQGELESELVRIREEYEKKKKELIERKNYLIEERKNLEQHQKMRSRAAVNARSEALREINKKSTPEIDAATLVQAESIIESVKTDVNRVKGNLHAALPGTKDQEVLDEILKGTFIATVPKITEPAEILRNQAVEIPQQNVVVSQEKDTFSSAS